MRRDCGLSDEDAEKLHIMDGQKDKKVKSVFEAFKVLNDWNDLVNSFNMLCGNKKQASKTNAVPSSAPVIVKKLQINQPNVHDYGVVDK